MSFFFLVGMWNKGHSAGCRKYHRLVFEIAWCYILQWGGWSKNNTHNTSFYGDFCYYFFFFFAQHHSGQLAVLMENGEKKRYTRLWLIGLEYEMWEMWSIKSILKKGLFAFIKEFYFMFKLLRKCKVRDRGFTNGCF